MMIKRWLLSLTLMLLLVSGVFAQDATQPLILIQDGDVWEWTGGPIIRQKTQWGYNGGILMSPLNDEVSYWSVSSEAIEIMKSGQAGGGGSVSTNIWVITTEPTDEAYRPAAQPATPPMLMRSQPMWSPDGTQLAWTEVKMSSDGTYTLIIYDKATETSREIASGLPEQYGMGAGLDGVWTQHGIVLFNNTSSPDSVTGSTSYIVFDPVTGERKFDIPAKPFAVKDDILSRVMEFPVEYQGKTLLGVLYKGDKGTSTWQMIDLESGQIVGETGGIIGYASGHAELSLHVTPVVTPDMSFPYYLVQDTNWNMLELSDDPTKRITHFSIAPDGLGIAYQLFDVVSNRTDPAIYVWRNGTIRKVPTLSRIAEFTWGNITWELGGEGPGL